MAKRETLSEIQQRIRGKFNAESIDPTQLLKLELLSSLETFTKELGAPFEKMTKLKVKSASSLPQTLTVVELQRS